MRLLVPLATTLLLLSPIGFAHIPPGPKNWCESPSEMHVHDYWPSGYYANGDPGHMWVYEGPDNHGDSNFLHGPWDGNVLGDCNGDTVPLDPDGHKEFAIAGAILAADDGGVYPSGFWAGASWGSDACLGEMADHVPGTLISLTDTATGGAVGFSVLADYARDSFPATVDLLTGESTICGDGIIEPCDASDPTAVDQVTCNTNDQALDVYPSAISSLSNGAIPGFAPGQNGAYLVLVWGSKSPAYPGAATTGHVYN